MNMHSAFERTLVGLAIVFAIIWLYGKFTTEPDWDVPPPPEVVHDRCQYISDGLPFYIGDDARTDIDKNGNGIACEPEDMK